MNIVARSERMQASGGRIEGGSPLAGHLGLPSLLVRETVQNAWDARDDDRNGPVRFSIEGWDLDTDVLDHLRALLPVKDLDGFERRSRDHGTTGARSPWTVLEQSGVRVLVISDRNTVGLCGPSRSGRAWKPIRNGADLERGQQRFANFIRNQGRAALHTGTGDGGAYGVGKSALWMASQCGTVVVHTRTTDEKGEPVERFIGTVHGDYFESGGYEYTGRHFVGHESSDGVIEPLIGAEAAFARQHLPIPPYEVDEQPVDGTSIVIVAPRLTLGWNTEMERIRDAVRWQVWPKRVSGIRDPEAGPDMKFSLGWNNHPVELPEPLDDPELRPYARALLDCARDRNDPAPDRDHIARCHRPAKILGTVKFREAGHPDANAFHLTLTDSDLERISGEDAVEGADHEAAVDFARPWGQVALIRRDPLLLVRYEEIGGPEAAATEVGVFLSAEDDEVEEALTRAEPPAHDEWNYKIVPKDHPKDYRQRFSKRTMEEIRAARKRLLATFRSGDQGIQGGGEQAVSRRISQGLFGGLGGGNRPKAPTESRSASAKGPRAVLDLVRSTQSESHTIHELNVSLDGLAQETQIVLTASGAGYDNSGSMSVDGRVSYRWVDHLGNLTSGPAIRLKGSATSKLSLVIEVESELRFRPKVLVEVAGGS